MVSKLAGFRTGGLLSREEVGAGHIDDYVIRYWYKPEGKRHAAVRGAGYAGFTTAYYYDPVLRPSAIINDLPTPDADMSIGLGYNPASQIASFSRDNDAYAWTGGVTASRDYAVNGQNQYGSIASGGTTIGSFAYDANGNLTSETNAFGTRNYVYDIENRLVSASGAASASLVYDPLGRLFQTSGGAAGTTQFLYDGDALVAEYDGTGALTRRYVHGPGVDEPVAVYNGPARGVANRRYTLPDERGSIVGLVNADGTPSKYNKYDEYGFPGGDNEERFQYTGQIWIPELGMYHYKARLYSPALGRFLQVDPIGYEGGVNLYAYVSNDPVNMTDPTGQAGSCEMCYSDLAMSGMDDEQIEGIQQAWAPFSEAAAKGMAIGASLAVGPELLIVRGGAFLAGRIASSSFTRTFNVANKLSGGLQRTGGSSGQKTWQGFLSGGQAAARKLFNGLTSGRSAARDGGRLGNLKDGSSVQMSTRTLKDGTIRTDVRISRDFTPTGSRIQRTESIKLRFDEQPR